MKIIIRTLLPFIICLLHFQLQAQVPQERIIRTYHVVEVRRGETLLSLSRSFNVPVEAIRKANPTVDLDDMLGEGMEIIIPVLSSEAANTVQAQPEKPAATPASIIANPFENQPSTTQAPDLAARDEKPATTVAPVKTQQVVLYHTVVEKQTLFAISRLYNVSVDDIIKWNNLIDNNIRSGMKLLIKTTSPQRVATTNQPAVQTPPDGTAPTAANLTPKSRENMRPAVEGTGLAAKPDKPSTSTLPEKAPPGTVYHTVTEKQTLFSISRLYNVSVDDIIKWNNLIDNKIRTGMQLIIKTSLTQPSPAVNQPADNPSTVGVKSEPDVAPKNSLQELLSQTFLDAKSKGDLPVNERVTIGWVASENPKMSGSYFCLHKTAPVGTIIKLTNLVNKKVSFVKVIGKLPETAENIIVQMRVSSSVKSDLMLGGDKAYVESEFYR